MKLTKEQNMQQSSEFQNKLTDTQIEQIMDHANEVSQQAMDTSKKAMEKSVELAKEYPLHTAVGAGVLGFVAGVISNKIIKS
jgi:ElaB/YqjD/DUF883 family membrane-anchored ribosome-binding protein